MGMSADEYWHGEPELTQAYALAYKIRKEERNYELWLQGLYIYKAVCVALSNAFEKNSKERYLEKPLDIFPPTKEQEEERLQKEADELARRLTAFERAFNERN